MRRSMTIAIGMILCTSLAAPTFAAPLAVAPCAKFTEAQGDKASLFAGYIYGFLAARMGYRDEKRLTGAAVKVRGAALAFCRKHQDAAFAKVVDVLATQGMKKALLPKL